ncbi:MAG: GNAT family N-acetyltransferase [Candidatus Stahlbacteria bacterium]|nr:MAG: GNAT family N-acetyltransferase [Candidatus Stahlbacteria bacterium]
MKKLVIKDVTRENVDEMVRICVPPDKREHPLFVEGMNIMKRWALGVIEDYASLGKLAYMDSEPVGMIQWLPNPEERLVEIRCIFVRQKENLRKGVGRALLKALIDDMGEPKSYFDNDTPLALVTTAFEVWGVYPQHKFYEKMGFMRAKADDPFLLYYPIKEGYVHVPKEESFNPQKEDEGKALIFYKPSCPFSIYFSEKMKESIKEVAPDIPIRMVNRFEEAAEVRKRGSVPACVVNKKPIQSFVLDKTGFQKEVKEGLKHDEKP